MPYNKPLRSVLYVPADNEAALAKSQSLAADAFIFDLEDAVEETQREQARNRLGRFLKGFDPKGRPTLVRLGNKTNFSIDLLTFLHHETVTGFVLPKMETAQEILALDGDLDPSSKEIWAMVETAKGLYGLPEILHQTSSAKRLKALLVGSNDLMIETGVDFQSNLDLCAIYFSPLILGARAHNLVVLDGVYNNFEDKEGFKASCENAHRLGFTGKTLIHPSQIEAANAAFSPNMQEVEWAQKIVAAFELEENAGKGVISVDGKMVERLHLKRALAILTNL